jgi:hypothetical protein
MNICIANNMTATFGDLHVDQVDLSKGGFTMIDQDATPFQCTETPLAPVTWSGLDGN